MKTQNTNLTFNRKSIIDLNENELENINGGSTPIKDLIDQTITIIN